MESGNSNLWRVLEQIMTALTPVRCRTLARVGFFFFFFFWGGGRKLFSVFRSSYPKAAQQGQPSFGDQGLQWVGQDTFRF